MNQSPSLTYGFSAGLAVIAYMLLFYFIDPHIMLSAGVYWSSLIIFILCMYFAARAQRAQQKDYISLKEALQTAFTVYVIANALFYAFYYLLFNAIDPGLEAITRQITIDSLQQAKENGLGEIGGKNIDQLLAEAEKADYGVSLVMVLRKFAYGVIGGFLISLLIAAAVRRENPLA